MINQIPRTLFSLEGIQDPAVRDNFDRLNRELQRLQVNKQPASANFRRGETDKFSVTITTRGNPVVVRLEAAASPGTILTGADLSYFNVKAAAPDNSCEYIFSLNRKSDPADIKIFQADVKILVGNPSLVVANSQAWLYSQFPVFGYTDDNGGLGLPAGTYTYYIPAFLGVGTTANTVSFNRTSLTAYELGG